MNCVKAHLNLRGQRLQHPVHLEDFSHKINVLVSKKKKRTGRDGKRERRRKGGREGRMEAGRERERERELKSLNGSL